MKNGTFTPEGNTNLSSPAHSHDDELTAGGLCSGHAEPVAVRGQSGAYTQPCASADVRMRTGFNGKPETIIEG